MAGAHVEYFRDQAGEWRWHEIAANGEVVATSGEGYRRRIDAVHGHDVALEGSNDA